jgi:ribosome-associated heat shock protein Hsp15
MSDMESVRIDRWLCAARVFKSRSLANTACDLGRVRLNDAVVKPHHLVRVGDQVEAATESGLRVLEVSGLAEKRLPAALARGLYEDHSPPPPPREERPPSFARGMGRGSKRDRRDLRRIRGR